MKEKLFILIILIISAFFLLELVSYQKPTTNSNISQISKKLYWFQLSRKSNIEYFYYGNPGDPKNSTLIDKFKVKSGIPNQSPTPLPVLLGKDYWLITNKEDSSDNPDTAPFFLRLNIPAGEEWPYGPMPYEECNGQCDWQLPGYFGLHGVGGNPEKLGDEELGSSGCVRHSDTDITYLYNILDPQNEEIRYYIID